MADATANPSTRSATFVPPQLRQRSLAPPPGRTAKAIASAEHGATSFTSGIAAACAVAMSPRSAASWICDWEDREPNRGRRVLPPHVQGGSGANTFRVGHREWRLQSPPHHEHIVWQYERRDRATDRIEVAFGRRTVRRGSSGARRGLEVAIDCGLNWPCPSWTRGATWLTC